MATMTDSVGPVDDGLYTISPNLRDSVGYLDGSSMHSPSQVVGDGSSISSSSISTELVTTVKTLDETAQGSPIETLVGRSLVLSSPKTNAVSSILASDNLHSVSINGFSSSLPIETEWNKVVSPSSPNLVDSSVSSSRSAEKNNNFFCSESNSNVFSPTSSMETLEDHLPTPSLSSGSRSPSSPVDASNYDRYLHSSAYQPISVIRPDHTPSEDNSMFSTPKSEGYSFSRYDQEDDCEEEYFPSLYTPSCQNMSLRSDAAYSEPNRASRLNSSWTIHEAGHAVATGLGAGLRNMGNTCFLNSVLQCFTHTVPLVLAVLKLDNHKGCNCVICSLTHDDAEGVCCAICMLRTHIQLALTCSGMTISPGAIVSNLNYFSPYFRNNEQEDAHEFMQALLDKLCSSTQSIGRDESLSSNGSNIIDQLFGGTIVSRLRCCNCGHVSVTYDRMLGLSLEIEGVESLQSALTSFTRVEKLDDPETKFTCDNCEQIVLKEKQLMLDQVPTVAVFHLKRFKNDGYYVEKIFKHVEFPLELDIRPYTIGRQNNEVELNYHLYGVIEHVGGSLSSGHYFCYIRSAPDAWYQLDDDEVFRVEEDFVLSQDAYILLYARNDTPWFSDVYVLKTPNVDTNILERSVLESADGCGGPTEQHKVESCDNGSKSTLLNFKTRDDCSASDFIESCSDDSPMTDASILTVVENCKKSHTPGEGEGNNCYRAKRKVLRKYGGYSPGLARSQGRYRLRSGKERMRRKLVSKASSNCHRKLALQCLGKSAPRS